MSQLNLTPFTQKNLNHNKVLKINLHWRYYFNWNIKCGVHLVVDGGDIALIWDEDGVDDVDVAVVALDVKGLDKGWVLLAAPDV